MLRRRRSATRSKMNIAASTVITTRFVDDLVRCGFDNASFSGSLVVTSSRFIERGDKTSQGQIISLRILSFSVSFRPPGTSPGAVRGGSPAD